METGSNQKADDAIRGIAAFHFGDDERACPFRSLLKELDSCAIDLTDFLVVLPEGFNVPDGYYGSLSAIRSIRNNLIDVSKDRKIDFVAGLIEVRESHASPPGYNEAYLISSYASSACTLMAQKKTDCLPGLCRPNPSYRNGPLKHRDAWIASLICNDFMECCQAEQQALANHPDWQHGKKKILCVPACSTFRSRLHSSSAVWDKSICLVAANGHADDKSFISGGSLEQALSNEDSFGNCRINQLLTAHF